MWLQFLLAVLLADLAQAVLHRAYHRVPCAVALPRRAPFQPAHGLAGRLAHAHRGDAADAQRGAAAAGVMGFSPDAVNAYVILVGLQAVLAHANLGLDFGWLEYLLVTPRYHHWHHARHATTSTQLRDPPAAGGHADGHLPPAARAAPGRRSTA